MSAPAKRKRKTTKSNAPTLPSNIRRTKKKKAKLNKIALLAVAFLVVNLYVTFMHGMAFEDILKKSYSWVTVENTQEITDDVSDLDVNIHDVDFDAMRAVIVTQTDGRFIPSKFGDIRKTLAEGEEVLLIKQNDKWWQIKDSFGTLMWVPAQSLIKN